MVVTGVLQSFVIPLSVVLEALGVDVDNVKLIVENLKKLVEDL